MIKQKQMFTVPRRLRASFRAVVHTAGSALSVLGSAPPEVATSLDTCSASCPTQTHAEPIRFASSSRRILVGAAKMWRQWLLSSLGRDVSMRNEKLRRHTCPSHSTLHHRNTFGRSDVNGTLILLISHQWGRSRLIPTAHCLIASQI